jgi:hypothetical protein
VDGGAIAVYALTRLISFWGTHMRPVLAVTITLMAVLIGLSWPDQSFAQATQTTTLGSLGIVAGQTVRVSAFREPYEDLEVTLCNVDLSFFDISGKRQATVTENLDPGKGASLDLPWADITPPPTSDRAEVNAVVDVTSDSKDGKPECKIATSVEVFDQASGRTSTSQGVSSLREDSNLAPPGSKVICPYECALEDDSCPSGYECWVNPDGKKIRCCNARPLQGWSLLN